MLEKNFLIVFLAIVKVVEYINKVILCEIALVFESKKMNNFNDVLTLHKNSSNFFKYFNQLFYLPT